MTKDKALEAALPGEAEAVMEQIAHKEQIGIWANELTSALSLSDFLREDWSFDDSVDLEKEVAAQLSDIIRSAITHPGLNLVASLQAMQARAEKAERENEALIDDAQKAWAKHGGMEIAKGQWQARAEAAEARVKELEEALEPFAQYAEFVADVHPGWDHDDFMIRNQIQLKPFRRARTALKGGSNG